MGDQGDVYKIARYSDESFQTNRYMTASDAVHGAQGYSSRRHGKTSDARYLTIESKGISIMPIPENYREVLIQLPGFAFRKLRQFDNRTVVQVRDNLKSHFGQQFVNFPRN